MPKLTKEAPQRYVSDEGCKYVGVPRNAWFFVPRPNVAGWIEAKHQLDYNNEPWKQFTPGEDFSPSGNRPPLVFETETALRRSIGAKAQLEKNGTIGHIGEDGVTPFKGDIWFRMSGAHEGDWREKPSGVIRLAHDDRGPDMIFISIQFSEKVLDGLCRELIARPNAMLQIRVEFAYYQDEFDERELNGRILLERNAQIPIIEAQVTVVDRPFGWSNDDEGRKCTGEFSVPAPIVVPAADFSPLILRLNWMIGLLMLLVLISLFK